MSLSCKPSVTFPGKPLGGWRMEQNEYVIFISVQPAETRSHLGYNPTSLCRPLWSAQEPRGLWETIREGNMRTVCAHGAVRRGPVLWAVRAVEYGRQVASEFGQELFGPYVHFLNVSISRVKNGTKGLTWLNECRINEGWVDDWMNTSALGGSWRTSVSIEISVVKEEKTLSVQLIIFYLPGYFRATQSRQV